jgi:hypothetical protein
MAPKVSGTSPSRSLYANVENRAKLQDEYEEFIIVANIQALSDNFDNPGKVRAYSKRNYEKLKAGGYFNLYQKKWREEINREKYLEKIKRNTARL